MHWIFDPNNLGGVFQLVLCPYSMNPILRCFHSHHRDHFAYTLHKISLVLAPTLLQKCIEVHIPLEYCESIPLMRHPSFDVFRADSNDNDDGENSVSHQMVHLGNGIHCTLQPTLELLLQFFKSSDYHGRERKGSLNLMFW
jgi:hypothetical protein